MTARALFDCDEVERSVDAYVDGEFTDEDRGTIDEHLQACPRCARAVRFQGAFKAGLKAAVPRTPAPSALRARVVASLAAAPVEQAPWQRAVWRAFPVAACAVLLFGLAIQRGRSSLVRDAAIDTYRRDLPLDVTGPADAVQAWLGPRVNFAVRPPSLPNAALVGARLANIRERQAAYLVYQLRGNRVSVIVFDPADLPMEARHHRQVGGREVLLDGDRGYNVALVRDRGVAYAFASDLDEDQMVQLVSSAINH